ncbi:uncharacterized protein [Glycine max]|uniref:uncharacterized protein n=1 Tax=Glycine max TaxID=3847 RepID=UPI0003DEBFE1|nr:uncharacterized protein LOC100794810 [Glycine max]|eukprot:XP_025980552.1 uncharacterized protein LOC100794810 [Glycine max]
MAKDRPRMTLEDYSSPIIPQYFTSIARPEVQAANFSYPYSLIQLIQGNLFHGLPSEDPYAHLAIYIDICNMVKIVGVPENATRLNLFSFSLAGKAKIWLRSFKGNSLRTWEEVVEKFLKKYFPESKTVEGKLEISSFHQFLDESLSEALDRFRGLLRKTPTHGYSEPVQLNIFIDGLRPQSKQLLDASAGGKIKLKTSEEAMKLIENMAASDHAILRDRTYAPTKRSLLELTTQDAILAQKKLLSQQIEALTETLNKLPQQLQAVSPSHSSVMKVRGCHICGGTHESGLCMVQDEASNEVNYMGSHNHQGFHQRGPPGFYQSDNFLQDHDWRYYPSNNFNQGGSPYQHPSQGPSQQEKPPISIEEMLLSFIQETRANAQETKAFIQANAQEKKTFIQETRSHQKSTDAAIRNLEIQIGQLAESIAEKPTETFAVNAEMKPKEDCKVIFTEREEEEKKTEEDVRDGEGEKKEETERNEEKAQQWEKYSQVEIQQESILQVNTPPHQLIVKEERHGKHEKALSVILSLIATTSLAIMWKIMTDAKRPVKGSRN